MVIDQILMCDPRCAWAVVVTVISHPHRVSNDLDLVIRPVGSSTILLDSADDTVDLRIGYWRVWRGVGKGQNGGDSG